MQWRLLGGFLFITQHKLYRFRHETISCEGLLYNTCLLTCFSVRAHLIICVFFSSFILLSQNKQILITISCSQVQGCFYIIEDEGDLLLMTVVQYLQHVHNSKVLSNSHPCFYTSTRCCCRKKPNQDDW